MVWERKAARLGLASATMLCWSGCSAGDVVLPEGNTGPYATVARVDVVSGPSVTTVGDSVRYSAAAYDNLHNLLPVTFTWYSDPSTVLFLVDSTGAGRALAPGQASVWASAGSAQSAPRYVTVNPRSP